MSSTCDRCVCNKYGREKRGQDTPEAAYDQMVNTMYANQKYGNTDAKGRPYDDSMFGLYCWLCSKCDQIRWFSGHDRANLTNGWSDVINWKQVRRIHPAHKSLAAAA